MPNKTAKQKWLEYADAMQAYHEQVLAYAQSLPDDDVIAQEDTGENPKPQLPPQPPK